jgi:hypothetical protein
MIGLCKDMTGGYGLVLGVFALMPIPVAVSMIFASPPMKIRLNLEEQTESKVVNVTA